MTKESVEKLRIKAEEANKLYQKKLEEFRRNCKHNFIRKSEMDAPYHQCEYCGKWD